MRTLRAVILHKHRAAYQGTIQTKSNTDVAVVRGHRGGGGVRSAALKSYDPLHVLDHGAMSFQTPLMLVPRSRDASREVRLAR